MRWFKFMLIHMYFVNIVIRLYNIFVRSLQDSYDYFSYCLTLKI